MSEYEFTEAEQAAIEQAAADHLEFNFAPSDARDMAYDIANDIRESVARAVVAEFMKVNYIDLDADHEDRYNRGQCAAVRGYLRHLDKTYGVGAGA